MKKDSLIIYDNLTPALIRQLIYNPKTGKVDLSVFPDEETRRKAIKIYLNYIKERYINASL